jgi:hypothetical protein
MKCLNNSISNSYTEGLQAMNSCHTQVMVSSNGKSIRQISILMLVHRAMDDYANEKKLRKIPLYPLMLDRHSYFRPQNNPFKELV